MQFARFDSLSNLGHLIVQLAIPRDLATRALPDEEVPRILDA